MDKVPKIFARKISVPGLVSLAVPPFDPEPGPPVTNRLSRAGKDPARDAFWYRRTFRTDSELPEIAILKIQKAAFGARVFLNGTLVGDHLPSFTPGYFDVRPAIKPGENELIIRVGADRDAVGTNVPTGFDFEKQRYIPGIFDSVELIFSGTPHFTQLQIAPDVTNKSIRVEARLSNGGELANVPITFVVRETKSNRIVAQLKTAPISLERGSETNVDVNISIPQGHLWSPEDPFLYRLEADSGGDSYQSRFGLREFRFEPAKNGQPGRAFLNGKPYFLRGSNFAFNRFLEDNQCRDLPWQAYWVKLLHQRVKEMHWNSLRYTIGFPPEAWYDAADEQGILIQDEFPFWGTAGNIAPELAREYTDWMRERWNHPSVVIWDAQNETVTQETGKALDQVRKLDLSNRPWDNGWGIQTNAFDCYEWHQYHFYDPKMRLSKAITNQNELPSDRLEPFEKQLAQRDPPANLGDKAIILNEYGWLWVNRDGSPTTLTRDLYSQLLGTNTTPAARFKTSARLLAAETEYWRCRRNLAGVLEFCSLGYSRPDGQTSDHWSDVKKLIWQPDFYQYVRDAFAPVGLMVDYCAERGTTGEPVIIPVIVINDLEKKWQGTVTLKLFRGSQEQFRAERPFALDSYGKQTRSFSLNWPSQPRAYRIEAQLTGTDGEPVRSVRDIEISRP